MQYLISDTLVKQDWETWEYEPRLCSSWDTEDSLILKADAAGKYGDAVRGVGRTEPVQVIYGKVSEDGGDYIVRALTAGNPLGEVGAELHVAGADVERVERGTVFTFHLRDGITWHDGEPCNADDLYFTWECYQNPHVDCDETRSGYSKLVDAEELDPLTIRFFYANQFFGALATVGEMPIL
ncbi:MAG TPA: hypothetical protein ENJ09_10045, partial [Planctomycetes bacterium]|nr:hypothetical protein [Planctomycetota bacterium]